MFKSSAFRWLPKIYPIVLLFIFIFFAVALVRAQETCHNDRQGADDEPGQKDLNRFCLDKEVEPPLDVSVSFQWDQAGWTGNNTGDACLLFDTNENGRADYSFCETIQFDPAQHQCSELYKCDADSRADRCMGRVQIACVAECTAALVQDSDPFHIGKADTVASCDLDFDTLLGTSQAILLDVCSYPSSIPNSDPSDCIFSPVGPTAVTLTQVRVSPSLTIQLPNAVYLLIVACLLGVFILVGSVLFRRT